VKVLIALTYYRPHVSGLTIYAERLATELARRGHEVTVLASRHRDDLAEEELVDGVRVVRVPVAFSISKGPIMPSLPLVARRLISEHDIVSVHLPMFEASLLAGLAKTLRTPTVLTYHCDLILPAGVFNRVVDTAVFGSNWVAAKLAQQIVAYTKDYAGHSQLVRRFPQKTTIIPPPVIMPLPGEGEVKAFREAHGLEGRTVLGFASRFATEKGIEYLIRAMPRLIERFPNVKVLFAGPYRDVVGEDRYRERLRPEVEALEEAGRWEFLGTLGPAELPAFYSALDVLLMTSINSTESFGLVQVEAMLCGTPVVSTNLPGVRQPVTMTEMGEIVAIADSDSLAAGIERVLDDPGAYIREREEIERIFDLEVTVASYEALFRELSQSS
jgi:glycosyltransferase involved in cell wall biosynthesis